MSGQNEHRRVLKLRRDVDQPQQRYECCQCGWTGNEDELEKLPSAWLKELGVEGTDSVCPKCGHEDFYRK